MPTYTVETHYLDVGQGDCSIIVVKDITDPNNPKIARTVVIDCGSDRIPEGDTPGQRQPENSPGNILNRQLKSLGIKQINILIISHFDRDHYNGIVEMLESKDDEMLNYFTRTKIYDMGCIYAFSPTYSEIKGEEYTSYLAEHSAGSWESRYKRYCAAIYQLNQKSTHQIDRRTERVYCGYPENFKLGMPSPKAWKFQPSNNFPQVLSIDSSIWKPLINPEKVEDNKLVDVQFQACNYLIGKDLMNEAYGKIDEDEETIPIHLWCLCANGWIGNPVKKRKDPGYNSSDLTNAFSIGVLLKHEEYTAWFEGDLIKSMEDEAIEGISFYAPNGLSVLKAGHHGAATSTGKKILTELNPHTVVITCGEDATHSHPSIETIQRISRAEEVKCAVVTGFDVKEFDSKTSRNWSFEERLQMYADCGFPVDFRNPFNNKGKFFVAGSSWERQLSHILIDKLEKKDNQITFDCSFYTAFSKMKLASGEDDSMMEIDEDLTISNEQVLALLKYKQERPKYTVVYELDYDSASESVYLNKKRKFDDRTPDNDNDENNIIKMMKVEVQGEIVRLPGFKKLERKK